MKLAGLVLGLGLVLSASSAHAKCETGTPTGASIPAKGSLYVVTDHCVAPKVGGPIVAQTKIDDRVVRLDYVTKADELEIGTAVFDVNPKWQAPAGAPRVIQYWHHKAGAQDSLMLQVDQPTAAFRVFWRFQDRPTRELVIPAHAKENNVNVLELDKVIDPTELAAGGILTLMAIRFDGSEVAVSGVPSTISTAKMPVSDAGVSRAIGFPAGTEPVAPVPPTDHDWPFHLFMLLLVPAAALTYVAVRNRSVRAVA